MISRRASHFRPGRAGALPLRSWSESERRRILVSRKWSGKSLADHRADRGTWLTGMLGLPATDPSRYTWEAVKPGDHIPNGQRLLHVVADRIQWQTALEQARRRAAESDFRQLAGRHEHPQGDMPADDPFTGLPLLLPVPRAAKLPGISRAAAYRFASAGDLPT